MNGVFSYIDNILCESGRPVIDFAKEIPVHLYSKRFIERQFNVLNSGIESKNKIICYALKANFNSQVVKAIIEMGGGIDCVSQGEIKHAIALGCDPNKIVFSGVGKTDEEIEFAILSRIRQISAESEEEVDEIIAICQKLKVEISICLRVNLDIDVNTHKYISTGSRFSKFGIDCKKIFDICSRIKTAKFAKFFGLSIHIGSQILDYTNFENAFGDFEKLIQIIKSNFGIKSVSVGGGLGVAYRPEDVELADGTAKKYIGLINNFHDKIGDDINLIIEPGRFLVANSCVTLAKVVRIKKTDDKNLLILNVGMNNIIRPALYQAYHHIMPVIKNEGFKKKLITIL